ncbi:serine/threonine-protein kinase [Actinosynnema sp. ALI-1.44]|uniref:serine/threonine-protein kinase n=1 Tax=Actinosynnema sp. ALI-1.44 TaxID=1933779 RepID=UPI00143D24A2|nr:serine/threonine-protein kinase [Actinosynnema sp. ALI-1.44]
MGARRLVNGRYRLEEQLGSGGMGVVWRATDEELHRTVALKRALYVDGAHDRKRAQRLKREARAVAKVNHPNVVTLHIEVVAGDELWLVMEYVSGGTLAEQGVLPPDRVARIGAQLADALDAVHKAGVLHRDVKPSNVLMTEDDRPKLSDFGVSRSVHKDITLSRTGGLDGTPGYLAPEVAQGMEATTASDVFSLGATLFAAAEGVSPVGTADNPQVLVWRAAKGDIGESHGPLRPVLARMLHLDPRQRPTAAQARQMLQDAANGIRQRPMSWFRSRPRLMGRAAILAVLLATWGLLTVTGPERVAETTAWPAIGEPRTADPCSLLDPAKLDKFGNTELDPDYGNFNRCDVLIRPPQGPGEVDVRLEFTALSGIDERVGWVDHAGPIQVVRYPSYNSQCERRLMLPDKRHAIPVITKYTKGRFPVDLCAVADTAVTAAVDRLLKYGTVPRRPLPPAPESLMNLNACALPDSDILAMFPGVDATRPEHQFGGWECRWHSTTSRNSTLTIRFDQHKPLTAAEGALRPFAGHPGAVRENATGPNTCMANVQYREYTDNNDQTATEALHVIVGSDQFPNTRMCQLASAIAEPLAAKLPG